MAQIQNIIKYNQSLDCWHEINVSTKPIDLLNK